MLSRRRSSVPRLARRTGVPIAPSWIRVRSLTGMTFDITFRQPYQTVSMEELQQRIADYTCVPKEAQLLVHQGRVLIGQDPRDAKRAKKQTSENAAKASSGSQGASAAAAAAAAAAGKKDDVQASGAEAKEQQTEGVATGQTKARKDSAAAAAAAAGAASALAAMGAVSSSSSSASGSQETPQQDDDEHEVEAALFDKTNRLKQLVNDSASMLGLPTQAEPVTKSSPKKSRKRPTPSSSVGGNTRARKRALLASAKLSSAKSTTSPPPLGTLNRPLVLRSRASATTLKDAGLDSGSEVYLLYSKRLAARDKRRKRKRKKRKQQRRNAVSLEANELLGRRRSSLAGMMGGFGLRAARASRCSCGHCHDAPRDEPEPAASGNPVEQIQSRVNPEHLSYLSDVAGFPKNAAVRALALHRNELPVALNWLLDHSSDASLTTPLAESEAYFLLGRPDRADMPPPSYLMDMM